MQDKENVSIIIVTHNDSKTIKRTLESVTTGIRSANQVIVGDNDSCDNTYEILCNLLCAKPVDIDGKVGLPPQFDGEFNGIPVRIFRKRLTTMGNITNIAIQMKWQGVTIFGFVDKGSWYAGDKIAQAIRIFNIHRSVACIVSDCDNHHADGRVERVFRQSFDVQRMSVNFPYDRNFLIRPHIFPKLKSGFNDEMPIRDDYDFLMRVSKIGLIYHIPAPLHHNIIIEMDEVTKKSIIQCGNIVQRRNESNG